FQSSGTVQEVPEVRTMTFLKAGETGETLDEDETLAEEGDGDGIRAGRDDGTEAGKDEMADGDESLTEEGTEDGTAPGAGDGLLTGGDGLLIAGEETGTGEDGATTPGEDTKELGEDGDDGLDRRGEGAAAEGLETTLLAEDGLDRRGEDGMTTPGELARLL